MHNSDAPRLVFYDDADPGIVYSDGDWFVHSAGPFLDEPGAILKGSQHGTFSSNASLSFSFSGARIGSSIALVGRIEVLAISESEVQSANWTCRIDGEVFESRTVSNKTRTKNRFTLCSTDDLFDGQHDFSLEVQASERIPFWVDSLDVDPPIDSNDIYPIVKVLGEDPDIRYETGRWIETGSGDCRFTSEAGATAVIDFFGTQVTWISEPIFGQPREPSNGSYTIDDGEPVFFGIPGLATGEQGSGTRMVFATNKVPYGRHRLSVTYLGSSAPLILDFLTIDQGNLHSLNTTGGPIETLSSNQPPQMSTGAALAIGLVCGGLFLTLMIALGWILFNRWKKSQLKKLRLSVNPFITAVATPTGTDVDGPASPSFRSVSWKSFASSSTRRVELVHHTDSGVRLPQPPPRADVDVVDVPPTYTPV
ncbi:hypothetical protein FA15DRAFT_699794 [Coprinopsis marcescibilis]|uniref:Transmembrane protein n=1 Tax=Coprinopsis marcescibilis TaxID=230819 RepID=A0A5C3LNG8_COPMA|nr:hypothetical protein FA15DRAFT_699794 [Coprinopsis marcescibilis]